jgi:hypothetical protein
MPGTTDRSAALAAIERSQAFMEVRSVACGGVVDMRDRGQVFDHEVGGGIMGNA